MRSHAEIKADFESGIALDMDGERRHPRRTPDAASDFAAAQPPTTLAGAAERARRTPEAQADIAAARASPTAMEVAMQEVDRAVEQSAREVRDCAHAIRHIGCPSCDERYALDAALSNAALADTPAVREMGGGFIRVTDLPDRKCRLCGAPYGTDEPHHCIGADAVVLTGPDAERYRALQTAARKARASAATARADGAALLQLFQAFCAGLAPGKEG